MLWFAALEHIIVYLCVTFCHITVEILCHEEKNTWFSEHKHLPYQHSSSWKPPAGFWSSECIRVLGSYETLCVSLALSPERACPYTGSKRHPYIVLRFSWTATGGSRWPTRAYHAATGCLSLRSSSTRSRPFLQKKKKMKYVLLNHAYTQLCNCTTYWFTFNTPIEWKAEQS